MPAGCRPLASARAGTSTTAPSGRPGTLINDNYFCRLPRRRSDGRGGGREACDTASFPRTLTASRAVSMPHSTPSRRRRERPARRSERLGAVPASSGSSAWAASVAAAGRGGWRTVRASTSSRWRFRVGKRRSTSRTERPGRDAPGRTVPSPAVRVGAELQQVDICGAGAERDVRGAGGRSAALWMLGAVPAGCHDNLSAATHELKRSGGAVDGAFPAGAGPLRAGLVADPAGEAA